MVVILVFWAITPLQSGIFTVVDLTLPRRISLLQTPGLISTRDQSEKLSAEILYTAYGISWFGEVLPPFVNIEGPFAPFAVDGRMHPEGENQILTATTKLYTTDLNCTTPEVGRSTGGSASFAELEDGEGCSARVGLGYMRDKNSQFLAQYIGYWDNAYASESLQLLGCPKASSHKFLAIWQRQSDFAPDYKDPSNATALFCQPTYFSQTVEATIANSNGTVVGYRPLGPKELLPDEVFNRTHFEYILGVGVPQSVDDTGHPQVDPVTPDDIIGKNVLYQDARLANWSITLPTTNMVGFAVGATRFPPAAYLDPKSLHSAFEKAHRILFAIAIHDSFRSLSKADDFKGVFHSTGKAVQLVPAFTFSVLGLLVLVLILTLAILFPLRKRHTSLSCDPGSISALLSITGNSGLTNRLQAFDSVSSEDLAASLDCSVFSTKLEDRRTFLNEEAQTAQREMIIAGPMANVSRFERPREWSLLIGIAFVGILVTLLAGVVYLQCTIARDNGMEVRIISRLY